MAGRKGLIRSGSDTEATGLNVWTGARPFAVSVYDEEDVCAYWEWTVDPLTRQPRVPAEDVEALTELYGDPRRCWKFWHLTFDVFMLRKIGVRIDVERMIAEGRIDEVSFKARAVNNLEFAYKLKPLAKKYLDFPHDDELDLHDAVVKCRRAAKKLGWAVGEEVENDYWLPETMRRLEPAVWAKLGIKAGLNERYCCRDSERTLLLDAFYDEGIAHYGAGARSTYETELELLPVTMGMQEGGVCVDERAMEAAEEACEGARRESMAVLNEATGRAADLEKDDGGFNVDSPKQVVDMLFGGKPLSLEVTGRSGKTGQPKTDAEHLFPHKGEKLVQALFRARANGKALTSFFGAYRRLAERLDEDTLLLHPGYSQWGALTGRYTCGEPALQCVSDPKTTNSRNAEYVVDIRQVFVPRPGTWWYCPDFKQVEVVIFADVSGEPTMLDAIARGADIHTATANKIWGGEGNPKAVEAAKRVILMDAAAKQHAKGPWKGLAALTQKEAERWALQLLDAHGWDIVALETSLGLKTWRKLAKTVTFTKIFGGGVPALMGWLGVGQAEAQRILIDYDDSFPDMADTMREIEAEAKANGHVTNRFGRVLQVDPWYPYRAVNYLVQSAAADLMKRGMLKCAKYLREAGLDARIAMTIHDELVFEFRREHAFKPALRELCRLMSDHGGVFKVPTPVDMDRVTERWSEKEKVEL